MRLIFLMGALFLFPVNRSFGKQPLSVSEAISSEEVAKGEYFIDADPGIGAAEELEMISGENSYTISLGNLSPGAHIFGARVEDKAGRWTQTVTRPLYISDEMLYVDMEYYIDEDPGKGYGTSVNHGHSKIVKFDVNTDNLPLGAHTLSVRLLDQQGKWGEVMTRPFVVGQKAPDTDLVLEYFYDLDPGVGNANKIAGSEGENLMYIPLDGLEAGAHIFGVRCMDKAANWTQTIVNPLYVVDRVALSKAEYYVDDDPGEGKGNGIAIGEDGKSAFTIPTSDLSSGMHQIVMRGMNDDGKWITLFSRPFEVMAQTTGIESIVWKLGFSYSKTSSGLKLESMDIPDGSIVSVIALNGQKLTETIWSDTTQPLYVDFNYAGVAVLHIQTPDKEISAKLVN